MTSSPMLWGKHAGCVFIEHFLSLPRVVFTEEGPGGNRTNQH